jgi:hypothetical protein
MAWWLVAFLLAVAAALAVALVAGNRLPPTHTIRLRARYAAAPDKVWDTITNMVVAPNWRSKMRQVERLPDRENKQVWVEVSRRWRLPLEFEVVEPGRCLVTRIVSEDLPFGGTWTYELVPEGSGTLLTVTEQGEIHSQTLRFSARYIFGYQATAARYLRDLGKKLGEKVRPERVA